MFLTLKCGQGLLITVDYDGLLRCGCTALARRVIVIVETLHVKLQMTITIKPEIFGQKVYKMNSCLLPSKPFSMHKSSQCKLTL